MRHVQSSPGIEVGARVFACSVREVETRRRSTPCYQTALRWWGKAETWRVLGMGVVGMELVRAAVATFYRSDVVLCSIG